MTSNLFDLFGNDHKKTEQEKTNGIFEEFEELIEKEMNETASLQHHTIDPRQCQHDGDECKQNDLDKIKDLKIRINQIELERDIFYDKNEELIKKLIGTNEQIKDIEASQKIIDQQILIKLRYKNKKIKELKKKNQDLISKCKDNEIKIEKQKYEIKENNKILKEKQKLNEKYIEELESKKLRENKDNINIKALKQENGELKSEILSLKESTKKSMIINEKITDKLEQNHRMIRYLQHFVVNKYGKTNIEFRNNGNQNQYKNNGTSVFRIMLIVILTMFLSLSWNDWEITDKWNKNNMNHDMDLFVSMKQISFGIYDTFMLSEHILSFGDLVFASFVG